MNRFDKFSEESDLYLLLNFSRGANSRKKILKTIVYGPKNCNQIAIKLGLNWRTIYRHLQILEKENFVKSFGFGKRKFYKLTQKGEKAIRNLIKSRKVPQNVKNNPKISLNWR
ncbi:MAG: ArsR/SmtB family transcription factor [Candidatus Bathyarchaeales archaeon]